MKSFAKFAFAVAATMVAAMGAAHAVPAVPEPETLSLVGLAIGAAAFFARRK